MNMLVFYTIYLEISGQTVNCPATYPYAFKHGKYCCKTNKDNNGNTLAIQSNSCQYHAYRKCPGSKCKNYEGIFKNSSTSMG